MTDEDLPAFLSRTPFFGGLDESALGRLVAMLKPRSVAAGEDIFKEGDQGSSMFVVSAGEVVVLHSGAPGEGEVELTRLRAGDFFGEMTLLQMQPRSATVRAAVATELLELRSRDLYQLYKQDLRAYAMVLQNINRELCRRLKHATERLAEWASHQHATKA